MTTQDPGLTQRQEFLQAASDIREAFDACRGEMALPARDLVRAAYARLYVLGSHVPDTPAGSPLPYGGMDDKDIAKALRHAENGMASPAVTLELIAELRRLREELRAMGGPFGVTDDDIRSMLGQGFHTAFRKAVDDPHATVIHTLIDKLRDDTDSQGYSSWSAVISFVANPLIAMLRRAETEAQAAAQQARDIALLNQLAGGAGEQDPAARLSLQPEQMARIEILAAVLEQADGYRYALPEVADRAVRALLHQLADGGNTGTDTAFSEGQPVEFRNRTSGAEWEPGTFVSSEEGTALVTDSKGARIRTPAERVRPRP